MKLELLLNTSIRDHQVENLFVGFSGQVEKLIKLGDCAMSWRSSVKVGDLIWYNTAGSQELAIVMETVSKSPSPWSKDMSEFAFVHWCGDRGGMSPAEYKTPYGELQAGRKDMGWVFARRSMWKVVK